MIALPFGQRRWFPAPVGEGLGWGQCLLSTHNSIYLFPLITVPTPGPSPTGAGNRWQWGQIVYTSQIYSSQSGNSTKACGRTQGYAPAMLQNMFIRLM